MESLIFEEARDRLQLQFGRLKLDIRKRYMNQESSVALKQIIHGADRIYDFGGFHDFLSINMLICCSNDHVSTRRLE